jgi:uncharacterized protein YpmS
VTFEHIKFAHCFNLNYYDVYYKLPEVADVLPKSNEKNLIRVCIEKLNTYSNRYLQPVSTFLTFVTKLKKLKYKPE